MKSAVLLSHGLLLAMALGCSNKEPAPQEAATSAANTQAEAASPQAAHPSGIPPLATAEGTTGGVRVEVTELRRSSGGTANLKFAIINDSDQPVSVGDLPELLDVATRSSYEIGGVQLIDPVGKKKYFAARDSEGKCVCSTFASLAKGARANHWAKFAAPPDDVERISIVIPHFSPMDDVPLSR